MSLRKLNTIMYIDDEKPNLVAFRAIFRRVHNIITASSALEATELLDQHKDVKVIISDQRMQGKTGIEFFESILESHPEPVRVILTGFSDQKAMIDSINRARVFRFLSKPWHEYDLKQTIDSAIELYDARNHLLLKQQQISEDFIELSNYLFQAASYMQSELNNIHQICENRAKNLAELEFSDHAKFPWNGLMRMELYLSHIIDYNIEGKKLAEIEPLDLETEINKAINVFNRFLDVSNFKIRLTNPDQCKLEANVLGVHLMCTSLLSFIVENNSDKEHELKLDIELLNAENGVQIIFTDNGKHLEEEMVNRILNTQETDETINPSLKVFKTGIQKNGGFLNVDTVPNAGTSYVVLLPNQG